ncbi:hypothetical protein LJC40_04970 [Synergistaceae bacterium OttesenSCG-928-D05]|nr:hypothetical protein [Synergistaceae bacterium OttesenSCG-928-D05]
MAAINPISTTLRLTQSAGQVDGKEVKKSTSVSNIDVEANADVLNRTAVSLGKLLEHATVETKRIATGLIVE